MPDYVFTFEVQGITAQKATAIRDRLVARLGEDNVVVGGYGMAQTTNGYRVCGVDTASSAVFDETVEATDADAARTQAQTGTRVVAHV